MMCGLLDGVDALKAQGLAVERVLLVGGAAASEAVREVAACTFDVPVFAPEPAEYVARGAARQAAWALSGAMHPPVWPVPLTELPSDGAHETGPVLRARYAAARDAYLAAKG
jgi:xylulokinase